jgi:hypothetical protein
MLSLATTATTYLGGGSPTLAGLAAAITTRLDTIVASSGAGPASVTVTPRIMADVNDNVQKIELDVTLAVTGTTTQPLDLGTDAAPTAWGRVYHDLNSAVNLTLRGTPAVESGTTFSGAFTVTVDLADSANPVASIAIPTLDLTGGFFGQAATAARFGSLDATMSATATPSLVTSVSFSGGGTTKTFTGAIISNRLSAADGWSFHYDEALTSGSNQVGTGWSLVKWHDLQGTSEILTLGTLTGGFLN